MNDDFMRRAIELARTHMLRGDGGPFGSVVAKDGVIVGEGWNAVTSTNDPTAHAEVMAIRNACQTLGTFDLTGADVYASCEPCPMCLATSYWANVSRIFYANTKEDAAAHGFKDAKVYEEIQKPLDQRSIPLVGGLRDEGRQVFFAWDAKPDKRLY